MAKSSRVEIEKFNGHNFELSKLKMEDVLVDKEQWIVMDPGTNLVVMLSEDWEKLDRKVSKTIFLCLSDSKQKCTTKINFIKTNRIQGDGANHRG